MAGTVAPMDVRIAAALPAGAVVNVAAFCRAQGISRKTFYQWRARFAAEGIDGLAERSRRPCSSPAASTAEVEDMVVRVRKELAEAGHDHGPDPIRWTLLARAQTAGPRAWSVPSRATIARILTRRGLIVPAPRKRPKSSLHRFVYPRPNECWQSDWTAWTLADDSPVAIAGTLDDHSRLLVGLRAGRGPRGDADTELVWSVMAAAIGRYGIPQRSLTDNGLVYSGARRGHEAVFEANLRALGCQPIASSPYHPQTCGKIERFWQTLKTWLRAQDHQHGAAPDLAHLNIRLEQFSEHYNTVRPHRALHGHTPSSVFAATEHARPAQRPLPAPVHLHHGHVDTRGVITVGRYQVNLGTAWTGHHTTTIADGEHLTTFSGTRLIRVLDADPTRNYQPAQPRERTYRHREPAQ